MTKSKHRLLLMIVIFGVGLLGVLAAVLLSTGSTSVGHTVYYISPTGSNLNAGTSPTHPWRSMRKADSAPLAPGDSIAFEGGATFTVSLSPWSPLNGSPQHPITYTSYGEGRANLEGGIYLKSESYLSFKNLNIVGSTTPAIGTSNTGRGVHNITVVNSVLTSGAGVEGYGIAERNTKDSNWQIKDDTIKNTTAAAIFSLSSNNVIIHDVITNPGVVGISLEGANNVVENSAVSGGDDGLLFTSASRTAGLTRVLANVFSNQSTAIVITATKPLSESFIIASNTLDNSSRYNLYFDVNANKHQTLSLTDNVFETRNSYLDFAGSTANYYTHRTYTERHNVFYGSRRDNAWTMNGIARTWSMYTNWYGAQSSGTGDTQTKPLSAPKAKFSAGAP